SGGSSWSADGDAYPADPDAPTMTARVRGKISAADVDRADLLRFLLSVTRDLLQRMSAAPSFRLWERSHGAWSQGRAQRVNGRQARTAGTRMRGPRGHGLRRGVVARSERRHGSPTGIAAGAAHSRAGVERLVGDFVFHGRTTTI